MGGGGSKKKKKIERESDRETENVSKQMICTLLYFDSLTLTDTTELTQMEYVRSVSIIITSISQMHKYS